MKKGTSNEEVILVRKGQLKLINRHNKNKNRHRQSDQSGKGAHLHKDLVSWGDGRPETSEEEGSSSRSSSEIKGEEEGRLKTPWHASILS